MSCGAIRLLIYTISHSLEITATRSGAICAQAGVTHRTPNLGIILIFRWLSVAVCVAELQAGMAFAVLRTPLSQIAEHPH